VWEQWEGRELCVGMGQEPAESFWVSNTEQTGAGDAAVGVCCGPPDQEEQEDEALCRQTGAASRLQALVLTEGSSHPSSCWKDGTAGHEQARRFLESTGDNFPT